MSESIVTIEQLHGAYKVNLGSSRQARAELASGYHNNMHIYTMFSLRDVSERSVSYTMEFVWGFIHRFVRRFVRNKPVCLNRGLGK